MPVLAGSSLRVGSAPVAAVYLGSTKVWQAGGGPGATVPGAPTGVSAVAGVQQATVTFTAPVSNGGAAITSYRVRASTGQEAAGASSPITVTGLGGGTPVTFTVAAVNTAGEGPESAPSTAVTPTAPSIGPAYVGSMGVGSFAAPASQVSVTTTRAAAAGQTIVLATVCNGNPGTTMVEDSTGNEYLAKGSPVSNGTASTVMLHASRLEHDLPAGAAITLTFGTERNLASMQAHLLDGLPGTGVDGIGVSVQNATKDLTTGEVTTEHPGGLLFAAWAMAAGDTLPAFTPGPGWAQAGVSSALQGSSRVLYTQWLVQGQAGPIVPAAAVDSNKNAAGVCIAFPGVDTSGQVGSGASGTYDTLLEVQAAGSVAVQGDVVELAPSTTYTGKLKFSGLRGTEAHPIVIQGPRSAVVDNGNTSSGYVLHLDDCRWVTVKGFTLVNGQKGVIVDRGFHVLVEDLDVGQIGQEGVHLRNETSYSTVRGNSIHDTGLVDASFGEAMYCGTAQSNWGADQRVPAAMKGFPDHSDFNVFEGNTVARVTAECVDIKEGTVGGTVRDNTFDGALIQGANSADSWVDVKGESWLIEGNTGTTIMTDGYQTHEINFDAQFLDPYVDGLGISHAGIKSGCDNVFDANICHCSPATGYGFWIMPGTTGNIVYDTNVVDGAASGFANIAVTPKPGATVHGKDITADNTGYAAFFDTSLNRTLTLSDLTAVPGVHHISDYVSAGTAGSPSVVARKHFTGDIVVDVDHVTFQQCLFDNPPVVPDGSGRAGVMYDYCTVDTITAGDWSLGTEGYSAHRSKLMGSSDGIRAKGGASTQHITECFIRVRMQSASDHCDVVQNDGGDGTVIIERCNLSVVPVGGLIGDGSTGGPSSVAQFSEFGTASQFRAEFRDCWIDQGDIAVYALRLYDGARSTGITYAASGNIFVRRQGQPVHRGSAFITPTAQIEWSGNRFEDDPGTSIPLA